MLSLLSKVVLSTKYTFLKVYFVSLKQSQSGQLKWSPRDRLVARNLKNSLKFHCFYNEESSALDWTSVSVSASA